MSTQTLSPGPGSVRLPRRRGRAAASGRRLTMTTFALPALIVMLVVNAYPVIYAAIQSLHNGSLLQTGPFVGFANFGDALTDPAFWSAARFTLIFALCGVLGSWVLGFALSLLLQPAFPGKSVYRVLLLLPWIVPIVVSAMSWNWLVATRGSIVPEIARSLGMGNVLFLANPTLAAIVVCIFKVWISYPFMMMMTSAALETIDSSVYEAAHIDGTTAWQRLRYIVLPITSRSTYISWILMAMFSVNDFATIYLLTGGGPVNSTTSLVVLAYQSVFQSFLPGYGVAVAFLMTAALVIVSVVLFRQIRKAGVE